MFFLGTGVEANGGASQLSSPRKSSLPPHPLPHFQESGRLCLANSTRQPDKNVQETFPRRLAGAATPFLLSPHPGGTSLSLPVSCPQVTRKHIIVRTFWLWRGCSFRIGGVGLAGVSLPPPSDGATLPCSRGGSKPCDVQHLQARSHGRVGTTARPPSQACKTLGYAEPASGSLSVGRVGTKISFSLCSQPLFKARPARRAGMAWRATQASWEAWCGAGEGRGGCFFFFSFLSFGNIAMVT